MLQICETQRLVIRKLCLSDVPDLTDILSDPEVMNYSVHGVYDQASTGKFIEWCLACYDSHGVGPWALIDKKESALIGFCGAGPELVADIEEINLGYRLASRYWNKGLASEATKAVLNIVFAQRKFHSVVVIIEPANVASLRVAEKLGFSNFDTLEFHGRAVRLYRLTSAQWDILHNNPINVTML